MVGNDFGVMAPTIIELGTEKGAKNKHFIEFNYITLYLNLIVIKDQKWA